MRNIPIHKFNQYSKLKKLKRWMSDFNRIAKAALANDRQALEALGLLRKGKNRIDRI